VSRFLTLVKILLTTVISKAIQPVESAQEESRRHTTPFVTAAEIFFLAGEGQTGSPRAAAPDRRAAARHKQ